MINTYIYHTRFILAVRNRKFGGRHAAIYPHPYPAKYEAEKRNRTLSFIYPLFRFLRIYSYLAQHMCGVEAASKQPPISYDCFFYIRLIHRYVRDLYEIGFFLICLKDRMGCM